MIANPDDSYTLAAADPATVTAELAGLTFTPAPPSTPDQAVTTLTLLDRSSAGASATGVSVTVIDTPTGAPAPTAPAIAGTRAIQATAEEAPVSPFAGVTVTDGNAGAIDTLTITLSGGGGTLSGAGLIDDPDGSYTLAAADPATLTAELQALSFAPTTPATGTSSTTILTLVDQSSVGAGASDATTTVIDNAAIQAPVTIIGTGQNDTIAAPQANATLVAGRGADTFDLSGTGSDTIKFSKGDGHDTVDNPGSGYIRSDVLDLTDILPSEVNLSRSGDALTVTVPSTGDAVHVLWQFYGDGTAYGLGSIAFADGTTWDRGQILAAIQAPTTIIGTGQNDTITAPQSNATLIAGRGADTFDLSGTGADTIKFSKGDGHDTVDNLGSGYIRSDVLDLTDVLPSEVSLSRSGDALTVTVPSTGDAVHVLWQFYGDGTAYGLGSIAFADGTTWDRGQILAATQLPTTIIGTGQNDTVAAPQTNATLVAGRGADTFDLSGTGADTIKFSKGDGHDTVDNPGSGYIRSDVLDLTDVLPSEVNLSRSGDALTAHHPSV